VSSAPLVGIEKRLLRAFLPRARLENPCLNLPRGCLRDSGRPPAELSPETCARSIQCRDPRRADPDQSTQHDAHRAQKVPEVALFPEPCRRQRFKLCDRDGEAIYAEAANRDSYGVERLFASWKIGQPTRRRDLPIAFGSIWRSEPAAVGALGTAGFASS
jgi:hypothetical protein